jgi:hypothetical protein
MVYLLLMDAPNSQFCWQNPNDAAHPLGLCIQFGMPQKPMDILGYRFAFHIQVDQTIPLMTQALIVEVAIECEERWSVQLMQQRNYFVVFHALPTEIFANLP